MGLGPICFFAHTIPAKILVAYCILIYAWFVAKLLATNGYPSISLIDYYQKKLSSVG
jgi:hypothetical protein